MKDMSWIEGLKEDFKDMKWTERLSVISSIASITGVSLVWLQGVVKEANFKTALFGIVASVVGALVTVGLLVVSAQLFVYVDSIVKKKCPPAVWGYGLFAGAGLIWSIFFSQLFIWALVGEAWTVRFSS